MTDSQPQFRIGIHVQLYFWIALLALSILLPLLISLAFFDAAHVPDAAIAFACALAVFQLVFWWARRRCSTPDLPAWYGLQFITSYMTIGIGSLSLLVAVPCTIIAVLGLTGIAVLSVGDPDSTRAQARFRAMVVWFGRHRMYQ